MLVKSIKSVFIFFIAFVISLAGLRLFGFFLFEEITNRQDIFSGYGLMNDLSFSARLFSILFLLQLPINLLLKKENKLLYYLIPPLFFFTEVALLEYYKETITLLDEVLYAYSIGELFTIVDSGGSPIDIPFIIGIVSALLIYVFLSKVFTKYWQSESKLFYSLSLILIGSCFFPFTTFSKNEDLNQLANNKTAYLISRTIYFLKTPPIHSTFEELSIESFKGLSPSFIGGQPIDENYPYFHELSDEPGLEQYFNQTTDGSPPNIVFLICESLGANFIGDNASETGRIMPFLDSLKDNSLYWSNFLSLADRTYQVLPAVTASIPIMANGKLFMETQYPDNFSLMNLLSPHYFSRFYCGTYLNFTNMGQFMKAYGTTYNVRDWEKDGFTDEVKNNWGFAEEYVFQKSWIDYKHQKLSNQPRIDFFLTNTTHPPYEIPNKEKYKEETLRLIEQNTKKYNESYDQIKNKIDVFSTFFYLDTQIKEFFETAQNNPRYENTIFIIFGDHGPHGGMSSTDKLTNYRIPLVIHSPLLKKSKHFKGVSSYADIPVSLIQYLKREYLPELPDKTTFIGKGLSFSEDFSLQQSYIFGTNVRNDEYIIHDDYFMYHRHLFKIDNDFKLVEEENNEKFQEIQKQRDLLRNLLTYTVYKNKFAPKDYISKYIQADDRELLKIVKRDDIQTKEGDSPKEFSDVGGNFLLESSFSELQIEFEVEYKSDVDTSYTSIPRLTFSIVNEQDSMLTWGSVSYFDMSEFQQGEWNHIKGKGIFEIPLSYFEDYDYLKIKYFIFNNEKQEFEMRNSLTKFYKSNGR